MSVNPFQPLLEIVVRRSTEIRACPDETHEGETDQFSRKRTSQLVCPKAQVLELPEVAEFRPEIGRLARARTVLLADNQLEGRIPPEIGLRLVSADTLYLSRNNLSGPIPKEVGNLESLVTLALFENQLTGPLPASLGNLKRLEELILSDNRIDGPLPGEISEMTSLKYFSISRNRVSGPIPPRARPASRVDIPGPLREWPFRTDPPGNRRHPHSREPESLLRSRTERALAPRPHS